MKMKKWIKKSFASPHVEPFHFRFLSLPGGKFVVRESAGAYAKIGEKVLSTPRRLSADKKREKLFEVEILGGRRKFYAFSGFVGPNPKKALFFFVDVFCVKVNVKALRWVSTLNMLLRVKECWDSMFCWQCSIDEHCCWMFDGIFRMFSNKKHRIGQC